MRYVILVISFCEFLATFDKDKIFFQVKWVLIASGLHYPQDVGLVGVDIFHLEHSNIHLEEHIILKPSNRFEYMASFIFLVSLNLIGLNRRRSNKHSHAAFTPMQW